jgi:signal transduction histidine kinase
MGGWNQPNFTRAVSRYALALFVTAICLLLRGILDPMIGSYVPYLAVLPAVILSARFCGLAPSLLATLVAFLGEQYWFIPPIHSLQITGMEERVGSIVYFLVSFTIIGLAETNRRTMAKLAVSTEQLRRAGAELEGRVMERTRELREKNTELLTQTEVVRELSSRLLQLQDDERRRIARELHDSAGQLVAALSMNLSKLQRESTPLGPNATHTISEHSELLLELSREIRTVAYLLHPPLLDEVGLGSALRLYVEGFAERSKLHVRLDLPTDLGSLSREMETAIFRIVQECLTNVHRHSNSPSALVRISMRDSQLRVEVEDSGKGIPPEKQSEMTRCAGSTSVGMAGMRERVRLFGGQLEVSSSPGHTLVAATFPIPKGRARSASA